VDILNGGRGEEEGLSLWRFDRQANPEAGGREREIERERE